MLSLQQSPRQKRIRKILQSSQPISTGELAREMSVSDSTLRRDLRPFLEAGIVQSQAGKLQLGFALDSENPFILRAAVNEDEKKRIARSALGLVKNGETIFIAGGTTTLEFARLLPETRRLKVTTNSLLVAGELAAEVRQKLAIFAASGGYVLASCNHTIDVPPENILAMFAVARGEG